MGLCKPKSDYVNPVGPESNNAMIRRAWKEYRRHMNKITISVSIFGVLGISLLMGALGIAINSVILEQAGGITWLGLKHYYLQLIGGTTAGLGAFFIMCSVTYFLDQREILEGRRQQQIQEELARKAHQAPKTIKELIMARKAELEEADAPMREPSIDEDFDLSKGGTRRRTRSRDTSVSSPPQTAGDVYRSTREHFAAEHVKPLYDSRSSTPASQSLCNDEPTNA